MQNVKNQYDSSSKQESEWEGGAGNSSHTLVQYVPPTPYPQGQQGKAILVGNLNWVPASGLSLAQPLLLQATGYHTSRYSSVFQIKHRDWVGKTKSLYGLETVILTIHLKVLKNRV